MARVPIFIGQNVDHGHCGLERETIRGPGMKNSGVAMAYVLKDSRSWVHDREVIKGAKETHGGHFCKLLRPLHGHHLALVVVDYDMINEDIETTRDEGGGSYRVSPLS
jgi:hypothetical protein